MRLSKLTKKGVSVALALSMVVAGTAGMTQKASAAKKFKTYVMFADDKWKVTANMNTAKGEYDSPKTIKAKKGTQNVSMTLTKGKLKTGAKEKTSTASVFCVDIENAMKTYKPSQIKISKVKIYVDGKAIKVKANKLKQGYLEKDQKNNKFRLEIFNVYGKGGTGAKKANYPVDPNKLKFKKSLKVSFKLTFKK